MSLFSTVRDFILDLLFPEKCVFCRRILNDGEKYICAKCTDEMPFTSGPSVKQTGEFFDVCVSPFYYKGKVRDSIRRYKFNDRTNYADYYAKALSDCISQRLSDKYDLITWVPISQKRFKTRGYDQAKLLAETVAPILGYAPVQTLKKTRDAAAQSSLGGKAERRANISGAYEVTREEIVEGKRILLIDDIITTGSTLSECAKTLLMAGAESVVCATVARSE